MGYTQKKLEKAPVDEIGVYLHWPFCESKCPYCDFNSYVSEEINQSEWADAYVKEIEYYAALLHDKEVTSIYFGGGTPSLMSPDTVHVLIDTVHRLFSVNEKAEITLEANPSSIELKKFEAFNHAGVNRVSVGIQSLKDNALQFLGRKHTAKEALLATEITRRLFDYYNFDFIYARPEQTTDEWTEELEEIINISGDHLSLYQLTIEKGTSFYTQQKRGSFIMPTNDHAATLYERTQEIMSAAGFNRYEVSNHAKEKKQSFHNLTYWRYDDYIGIGPGAHGRVSIDNSKLATQDYKIPQIWLNHVKTTGHGTLPFKTLSRKERFEEAFMMGMRLVEGVSIKRLECEFGQSVRSALDVSKIEDLVEEGFIIYDEDTIKATDKGMLCLNAVLSYVL